LSCNWYQRRLGTGVRLDSSCYKLATKRVSLSIIEGEAEAQRVPFDETIRGYERLISGKTQGKVMVRVAG